LNGTVTVRGQERAHPPIPSTPRRQMTDPCNKAGEMTTIATSDKADCAYLVNILHDGVPLFTYSACCHPT
jgi:hypothetical protein